MTAHTCRVCGCTDDRACIDAMGSPCLWVEADLCSECAFRLYSSQPARKPQARVRRPRVQR